MYAYQVTTNLVGGYQITGALPLGFFNLDSQLPRALGYPLGSSAMPARNPQGSSDEMHIKQG